MARKIKLTEAAKDLQISVKELSTFFEARGKGKKNSGAALSEEEMNLALEYYTQRANMETFDAYFAEKPKRPHTDKKQGGKPSRSDAKNAGKSAKAASPDKAPSGEKPGQRLNSGEKTAAAEKHVASGEKSAQNVNASEKAAKISSPNEKTAKAPAPGEKSAQKTASSEKVATPSSEKQHSASGEKVAQTSNEKAATSSSEKVATASGEKTAPEAAANSSKANAGKPQGEKQTSSRKRRDERKKSHTPQVHGEKTRLGGVISENREAPTGNQRTVDTRGSYVNLEKYNEHYEQIAPNARKKDSLAARKQKIKQKSSQKNRKQGSRKQETEAQRLSRLELERARKQQLKVRIPDMIQVGELASRLKVTAPKVIGKLMNLGVMATVNEDIDFDTAALVAEELGAKVEREVVVTIEERLIESEEKDDENQQPRPPVVVVMGHVDHGKTSILDAIRHTSVTASEAGGITQHIGAYQVVYEGKPITFLDTPGHEAFTSMRARGANITDIAVLVIAADDGIMPQTVESINHAKAAGVSVIVAMNKMDKEGADPERVRQQLTEYGLVCEEWGGDTICIPVSAKTGEGIDSLLENILLLAEVRELTANPDRPAKGTVIEARLDRGRGPVATLLVQKGTLHTGDVLLAGTAVGKVRVMTDWDGKPLKAAGPSVPVEITGLDEVPGAGDTFDAVADERLARELVAQRKHEEKEAKFGGHQNEKLTLDNLFSQLEEGERKELPIVVKADVQGSAEAVKVALEKLSNDEVTVRVIHSAVGAIKESDVLLASASDAIIVGFNVRPEPGAADSAAQAGVDIRLYRVIYDAIDEISTAMKGMLAPQYRENALGKAEVRQLYKISGVGAVAGSYVLEGKLTRQCQIRVVRDGVVVAEDRVAGLQRFKDSVREVTAGYECGISLEKFSDFKVGDIFEAYVMETYQPE